jgi:Flp pilus assembly protein CpaB
VRRTSRLLVLFGIGLAVLTFVLVIAFLGNGSSGGTGIGQTPTPTPVQNVTVVTAAVDIPLGTVVTGDMLGSATLPANAVQSDAYLDPSQVIGQIARQPIFTGAQVTKSQFSLNQKIEQVTVPPGKRALSVYVSDLTGVGRLIHIGDTVDLVLTFDEATIKVLTLQPGSQTAQHDDAFRPLTVKAPLLLQDIQVIGTLEAPAAAPAAAQNAQASATPAPTGAVADANAQKLIILAVTDAQAEAILFARSGGTIDLVLRSPADEGTTEATDGVILKTMFQKYGVVPPYVLKNFPIYVADQP